ncbi:MAG: acyl-ACP--UDP-N-acetylglucosamine O-acyltransferase [bacterium]|nr:acyl-ACP--UDP-N-acetylglucosamine O-acyltransferase [bacterium]
MNIHKTAMVDRKASLGKDITVGPNTIIYPNVEIGSGTIIGANVVIEGATKIGRNCQVFTGAVIGNPPQDLKYAGEDTKVTIGDNSVVREYVTLNRGTVAQGETSIGSNCLLMAYVHIAHDCIVGNSVVIANNGTLAGHVQVADGAIIGGLTAIHQFVKVGELSIIGGASRVSKDIPPYTKSAGNPLKMYGLNTIGLERNNVLSETRKELKKAYRVLFRSNHNTKQALNILEDTPSEYLEVSNFINFIRSSERGISKE